MHNFRRLDIWIESRKLVKNLYLITSSYPKHELFGIVSQIQRAAVSIPTNIAEGSAKSSNKDFSRFLEISLGSALELETLMILSLDLEYITQESFTQIESSIINIQKKICNFKKSLG